MSYRRSSGMNHYCDETTLANNTLLQGEGNLRCFGGCNGTIAAMSYFCTDYSEIDDVTTGQQSLIYTFPYNKEEIYQFGYEI